MLIQYFCRYGFRLDELSRPNTDLVHRTFGIWLGLWIYQCPDIAVVPGTLGAKVSRTVLTNEQPYHHINTSAPLCARSTATLHSTKGPVQGATNP
jgi:hypothetical protein